MKRFSQELQQMLTEQKGYRNEEYSGSGITDPEKVLTFEIYELGNTDILEFFQKHYGFDYPCIIEQLEEGRVTEEEIKVEVKRIISYISRKMGAKTLYCLWLATREGIRENYVDTEDTVTEYNLSRINYMPICDLGDQGALFILDRHPNLIPHREIFLVREEELSVVSLI